MNGIFKHDNNKINIKDQYYCKNILKVYKSCIYSNYDTILCNKALELYNLCIKND